MVTDEDRRTMSIKEDRPQQSEKLFDVTGVIGTVYHDAESGLSPRQSAMLIVAGHGAEGSYSFPDEGTGTMWTVTVGIHPMQGGTL